MIQGYIEDRIRDLCCWVSVSAVKLCVLVGYRLLLREGVSLYCNHSLGPEAHENTTDWEGCVGTKGVMVSSKTNSYTHTQKKVTGKLVTSKHELFIQFLFMICRVRQSQTKVPLSRSLPSSSRGPVCLPWLSQPLWRATSCTFSLPPPDKQL